MRRRQPRPHRTAQGAGFVRLRFYTQCVHLIPMRIGSPPGHTAVQLTWSPTNLSEICFCCVEQKAAVEHFACQDGKVGLTVQCEDTFGNEHTIVHRFWTNAK